MQGRLQSTEIAFGTCVLAQVMVDVDDCLTGRCRPDGSTCTDGTNNYTCTCLPGFEHDEEGPYCLREIDECLSIPCMNGGTCNDLIDAYTCTCIIGFDGFNCENNIGAPRQSPHGWARTLHPTCRPLGCFDWP